MSAKNSTQHKKIKFNLRSEVLITQLKELPPDRRNRALKLLGDSKEKIERFTWQQLYNQSTRDPKKKTGLNLEKTTEKTPDGKKISVVRLSRRVRLRVVRMGEEMVAYSIHDDHDSAYPRGRR